MRCSTLRGKHFPDRKIVILPTLLQKQRARSQTQDSLVCSVCNSQQSLERDNWFATQCDHMIQCNECSDYQIEKLYRCSHCCEEIIGSFPPPCSKTCAREINTDGVPCQICNKNLRKFCPTCKNTVTFKQTRQILREFVVVFVRHPNFLYPTHKRPCSHYSPCKVCSKNICKARKKSAVCVACREYHEAETEKERNNASINAAQAEHDQASKNRKSCLSFTYDVPATAIIAPKEEQMQIVKILPPLLCYRIMSKPDELFYPSSTLTEQSVNF